MIIVVVANVLYDVVAKSVPEDINTFVGLMITHFTLIIVNGAIYFAGNGFNDFTNQFSMINWAVIVFALTMVGLDAGYILLYRAGWNISLGTLVCNISLAIAMLIIGGTAFNEIVTGLQIVSVIVCAAGLVLISYMEIRIKTGDEEKIPYQG